MQNNNKKSKPYNDKPKSTSTTSAAKTSAKFSSLFKNNHEIPKVGDLKAKNEVKENLFSRKTFTDLDLNPRLVDCLEKRFDLTKMTQIQEKSIPNIIDGKDCYVKSQTGSGKTLAYAVPIVQKLMSVEPKIKRSDGIYALVLVPTRELALQTCQVFEKLCNACVWVVAGCLIGGMKKKAEKDRIRRGLNILVATPGRLCDHLDTTMALDLSKIQFLIFDEADRMLDMDFEKKINFIIFKIHSARKKALAEPELPKFKLDENGEPIEDASAGKISSGSSQRIDPQTILISATLTAGIKEIARRLNIVDPVHIDALDDIVDNNIKGKKQITLEDTRKKAETQHEDNSDEKIALPAGLSHYYVLVPSKLRLVSLIAFILDKFYYNKVGSKLKMIIFASTNDSVQFHDTILSTFLNRKFNMYLDDENEADDMAYDFDDENDQDQFSDMDDDINLNIKKSSNKIGEANGKKNQSNKKPKQKQSTTKKIASKTGGKNLVDVFSLYGNMDQHKRAEIFAKFHQVTSGLLICTDVAARGLDMPNIDWIVQYNPPGTTFDYVHRVGRSARVGHKGNALIYLEPCEVEYLKELGKLEISFKEMKLNNIMQCLDDESKYYPRQVADSLKFPRNSEECANSLQFYIEEFVEKSADAQLQSRKAYLSFIRSYSTYSNELKSIFFVKNLHLGHVAKSFGLRDAPKDIVDNQFKSSNNRSFKSNYDRSSNFNSFKRKREENGDAQGNNRVDSKKSKVNNEKFDLSGLLKNYKSVSEYSSGLESKTNRTQTASDENDWTEARNKQQARRQFNKNENRLAKIKKTKITKKIIKNMDIFD